MTPPARARRPSWLRRELVAFALGAAVTSAAVVLACPGPGADVATFNIRRFPETTRQIAGAFAMIDSLDVSVVAVQEIRDPAVFADAAAHHLGPQWRAEFGHIDEWPENPLLPGLLFDSGLYSVDYAQRHEATIIDGKGRATLEVRLWAPRGPDLHVFVVHLKADNEDESHRTRLRQLDALAELVVSRSTRRERVLVLGDFNTTREADRDALERFAARTGLHWTTRELACTSYWKPERTCDGSALDHVFSSQPAHTVAARGPCESVGCEPGEQCPIFYDEVSDHCPVTVSVR